jgi:pimeloyl-ACP methyl ester carboxylesterase
VTKTQRTARILAPAVLIAIGFVLSIAWAAPPTAPKFLELGKGPTIVLVHELGGNRMTWMPTAKKLIGQYRVVLVDLPGHAGNPLPDPFTLEASAEALDLVLARQNPDSTVIVGKGLGGVLSLMALKAHPVRARGLVLIETGLKSPLPIDDQQIRYFREALDENYDEMMKMIYPRLGRDSLQGMAIHAMMMQVPAQTMKAYWSALLTADASPAVKSLQVPYLFVGTDRLFPQGKATGAVLRTLGYEDTSAVSVRRIANAGYMVMQDQPDTLAAVISDFAARVLAAKRK